MENLYGEENTILDEFFPSNSYINFGYYPYPIFDHPITIEERIHSQAALYEYIFQLLELEESDHLLEVGCGRGDGCTLLKSHFSVASITGLDLTAAQISRSIKKHETLLKRDPSISFHIGPAEELPFASNAFTKIFSVEAAQHFKSLKSFAKQCARTLQSNGRVVITTFFALDDASLQTLNQRMPINVGSVDNVKPIHEILCAFQEAGFRQLQCKKIGQFVFPFFDQWLSQRKTQDWGRLWAQGWRDGLLEYYTLVFEKLGV